MHIFDISDQTACASSTHLSSFIATSLADRFLAGVTFHLLPSPPIAFYASIFVSLDFVLWCTMNVGFCTGIRGHIRSLGLGANC